MKLLGGMRYFGWWLMHKGVISFRTFKKIFYGEETEDWDDIELKNVCEKELRE